MSRNLFFSSPEKAGLVREIIPKHNCRNAGENMNRLVGFLQDDLKEIDESFEIIKLVMEEKIYYENKGDLEKHLEKIDRFIAYWQHHAKNLEEV
tara:strand:+ start:1246 stop:1527 length:282 start_codon:yes stop_codon:yes gene_type:complete